MRVAACADLHLDRIPSFLRDTSGASGHWVLDQLVGTLEGLSYDVLLLCGDIMDSEDSWFSCYGPLISGLERLKEAGVKVFAVAGNHDSNVFPRIAKERQDLVTVLGLGGRWSWSDWGPARFVGWSFPDAHFPSDPMAAYPKEADDFHGPIVGLLHCELQSSPSPSSYAPTLERELESARPSYWFLGHIHKRTTGGGRLLYCGSPYPLDRSEEGLHGFWSFNVDEGGVSRPEFVQLSRQIYATTTVDLSGVDCQEAFERAILSSLQERMAELSKTSALRLERVFHHLVFQGTLDRRLELERLAGGTGDGLAELRLTSDGVQAAITGWEDRTVLDLPLQELARRPGPVGALAALIQAPPPKAVFEMEKALLAMRARAGFDLLDQPPSDGREYIRKAGTRLLRKILAEEAGS